MTLVMLILLQAVLGIDNLLSISLESKKAPEHKQKFVRQLGIGIAIFLRIGVLFVLVKLMALTDVMWVMIVAIIFGGVIMIWLADHVARFLKKNRMYEVPGLFILFLVGVVLLTEAGHLSHLQLFGNNITAMNKTTFYFILGILILIDVVQSQYQKKLMKIKDIKS